MKPLSQIYIYILITLAVALSQKDNDEGRPYEFGFTIDGQQHRHEKKDQLGIVQGEFGFITADGVYHVTVYATDENGNFKILSMRNIRISAPLDGSPATGPISADAEKYLNKQKQLEHPPAITPSQAPQQPTYPTSQSSQQLQVITQRPGSYVFTTQPTIKPACGGCGYITQKPFQFQNPEFSESGPPVASGVQGIPQLTSSTVETEQLPGKEQQHGIPNLSPPVSQQHYFQNSPGGVSPPTVELLPPGTKNQDQDGLSNQPQINSDSDQYQQYPQSIPIENKQSGGNTVPSSGSGFGPNMLLQSPDKTAKLPPISVSDGTIHVGGNKPVNIPIKDKYPGMVDGLPNGIEEKDIKDILYKFHYTVGFHGHYEKGLKNGAKIGGYFVNGRDGISRIVTYIADENGYRPKFKFINLGLDSPDTPKEGNEKQFGLKSFEFVWYPIE